MGKLTFVVGISLCLFLSIKIHSVFFPQLNVPVLNNNAWWGSGDPKKEDTSIKPFKIHISDEILADLKNRLANTRQYTPPIESSKQEYGLNTNFLKLIIEYWRVSYNWREREVFLNKFPQYKTKIQGLDIHFLHVKPEKQTKKNPRVIPLLLMHGWPGSVREFYEMIPIMTTPKEEVDFVFEVIVPSLPGYGFSEGASKPGLGTAQIGVIFNNLMKRLGFEKYYVQGGDWGAVIAANMAVLFPENILGMHSNMCHVNSPLSNLKTFLGSFYPSLLVDKQYESKMYPLSNIYSNLLLETGYMHLQATKPDTVGVALSDSPAGLAAYILEKFSTWTEPAFKNRTDAGLSLKYKYADVIDNVMIYWVSGSITTSMRIYSETLSKAHFSLGLDRMPILVPSACARFTNELVYQPDCILKERYVNLMHSADYPGGHFAAFEHPEILAHDIWISINKMEKERKKDTVK